MLSPPNIVGVLTPFLVIIAMVRLPKQVSSPIDMFFRLWAVFMLIGCFFFYLNDPLSVSQLQVLLKLMMPLFIFWFLRLLIQSKKDLEGVLQTYLYSSLFVVAMLLYEVFISPIRVEESRGLERIQGNFADVMSYGFYITLGFLITAYFFFKQRQVSNNPKNVITMIVVSALCILALLNINHAATYGVFIALVLLFILYNFKGNKGTALFFIFFAVALIFFVGQETIMNEIRPLIEKDILVYEGERETGYLLHGRVGRWQYMWDEFSKTPFYAQYLGMPVTLDDCRAYLTSGTHNDFLRIMFLSGYIGFLAYLLLLFNIFRKGLRLPITQRFLVLGAFLVIVLYSITTTPTFYAPLMYIVFAVFAYTALPEYKRG